MHLDCIGTSDCIGIWSKKWTRKAIQHSSGCLFEFCFFSSEIKNASCVCVSHGLTGIQENNECYVSLVHIEQLCVEAASGQWISRTVQIMAWQKLPLSVRPSIHRREKKKEKSQAFFFFYPSSWTSAGQSPDSAELRWSCGRVSSQAPRSTNGFH